MAGYTSDEGDNFEEWTTSKRKVNHKTRQVETRVSRQLLVENGKVIADSGPQVTTRIKEDNKVEECEKEKTPKNKSKFEALEMAPEGPEGSCLGRVLGEKKEIQRVSREVREENMQYHDERFKELSGRDVHQKAIKAPHELITINDKHHSSESAPRGKMVHYSNKGKKYKDTDEILEVAKLAIDGSITKEVKRTHNHEEFSEDEKPDEAGEADELRQKPIVQRSSRRHVDYVNDYDDLRTPDASDNDEREEYDSRGRPIARTSAGRLTSGSRRSGSGTKHRTQHHDDGDDEAFPRYDLDPLLNSLRDEDFKPAGSRPTGSSSPAPATVRPYVREHSLERRRQHHADGSSDDDATIRRARTHQRQQSPASSGRVEIPEEYRVNKQRLMTGRKSAGSRERVHSPVRSVSRGSHSKQQHGRNQQRKEDAAVQAHLTDEEIERQSIRSSLSGGAKTHAKTTQHLQRQSTPNASRRYYYGNAATANGKATRRRNSITSSSSASSLASLDDQQRARQRQQGTRSRDSGFRSPQSTRTETPLSEHKHREQQIYSVSSKPKSTHNNQNRYDSGAKSPTLTTGSAGQRSVKTTTTTLAAGLADRPLSRSSTNDKRRQEKLRQANRLANDNDDDDEHNGNNALNHNHDDHYDEHVSFAKRTRNLSEARSLDTISVTSLNGPNATKIRVPYRHVIEIQTGGPASVESQRRRMTTSESNLGHRNETANVASNSNAVEKSSSEMSFQTDIESLSKRLASISRPLGDQAVEHFDYKTVETNIQSKPSDSKARQVIGVYNARFEQNSPFLQHQQILVKHNSGQELTNDTHNINADFTPNEYYIKYRATPALVDDSTLLTGNKMNLDGDDDDRLSQISSCSLQSSRTYKIRTIGSSGSGVRDQTQTGGREQSLNQLNHNGTTEDDQNQDNNVEFDENGNSKRPAAWIYDPRDGSSTAIVPPARPKRPETPKVETEELVQSRGGRSYYLEIVDGPKEAAAKPTLNTATAKPKMATSMDSIYSRWNSQGALNTSSSANLNSKPTFSYKPLTSANNSKSKAPQSLYRSTKQLNSAIAQLEQNRNKFNQEQQSTRRQLPFGGAPSSLGDKSKSSSCLLTVTKPSKYSIYGGFRKPGENSKPVPRLSYSRAIGPRSQRVDSLPKTPSRYLKMR